MPRCYLRFLLGAVLCTGCGGPSAMLYNPDTGQFWRCWAFGTGVVGAPLALHAHEKCVDSFKGRGFRVVREEQPR